MKILDIKARMIYDSRGVPTVEVDLFVKNGFGRASIPSGASTGANEALELRDNDKDYLGKGVDKALDNILNIIKPNIIKKDFNSQRQLDEYLIKLDGTSNKANLGANSILAVSLAYLKACANSKNVELYQYFLGDKKMPKCMMNILNGGMHASNKLEFQEFMIIPNRISMRQQLKVASEVFHNLKQLLKEKEYSTNVGDEGGFAPNLKSNEEALMLITEAIKKAGYEPKIDVNIALDVAATSFYNQEKDRYLINKKLLTKEELTDYYIDLVDKYPIISIEDPFYEEDFESFANLKEKLDIQIVGDDLFTTNTKRLEEGISKKSANAILIKANQIGTITETLDVIKLAKENNYQIIISHRSGETEDTFIADLAVGLNISQIKTGSISRGERICKYNRLLRIEENL